MFRPSSNPRAWMALVLGALSIGGALLANQAVDAQRRPGPFPKGVSGPRAAPGPWTMAPQFTNTRISARPNVRISPGVTNGFKTNNPNELADYIGLAFHGGKFYPAWTDNSTTLPGNPNPPANGVASSADIATAKCTVATNGTFTVGTNVNITRASGYQSEPSIAINPTNPLNLVAGSNDQGIPGDGMDKAFSTDGGATWTKTVIGNGSDGIPTACCDPSVAFDRFGNCFYIYLGMNSSGTTSIEVLLSTNGGQSFSHLKTLATSNVDQPTVVTGPGRTAAESAVWVTWKDTSGLIAAAGAPVTNLGVVGAFTAKATAPGSESGSFGDIVVGPSGQVIVTYQDPDSGQGPATIKMNLDPDGLGPLQFRQAVGITKTWAKGKAEDPKREAEERLERRQARDPDRFGSPINATTTNVGGFDFITPQPNRSVDAEAGLAWDRTGGPHNGRLYLVYTDETPNESSDTDIYVRYSEDNGATWSTAEKVNDNAGTSAQYFPKIALDQTTGQVAIAWYDARNDTGSGAGDTDTTPNTDVAMYATTLSEVTIPRFSISGTVRDNGAGLGGVTITANPGNVQVSTSTGGATPVGSYSLPGLVAGTYTLTAAKAGLTFTPSSITVTVGPNATGKDFSTVVFSVSGRVTQGTAGVGGATVSVRAGSGPSTSGSASPGTAIPDNNGTGITSTLNIGATSRVTSVSVTVGITHTYIGDLEVSLLHPDGTAVKLHDQSGGSADNLNTSYPSPTAPAQALDALFGKPANGGWKLKVRDLAGQDLGTLNSWRLDLGLEFVNRTATTTAEGLYSVTGLKAGSYTVTAVKTGLTLSPNGFANPVTLGPSKTCNFTAGGGTTTFSVAGKVIHQLTGLGVANVQVKAGSFTATTSSTGAYLLNLPAGSYSVTCTAPTATPFVFSPASVPVTVGPARTGVNFEASPRFSLSGRVTRSTNAGLAGTTLRLTGAASTLAFARAPQRLIPDNNTTGITEQLTASAPAGATLTGVQVQVAITHPHRGDLSVTLVHPSGTSVVLYNGPRTDATANLNVTFPTTRPSVQSLGVLNGKAAAGVWKLVVKDLATGSVGTLNSWKLTLNFNHTTNLTATSINSPTASLVGNYVFSNLLPGTYKVTPAQTGRTFTPAFLTKTLGPNATGVNFKSNQP